MRTKKILVVDDEQNIRDIFQAFLRDMGYVVSTAIDGIDALEKISKEKFDLYFVDIYMPRMGGLELISRLKEIQPSAVIIVTTGYSGLDVDFRSIRQSAFMYLAKPIQPDELIRAVEAGLAQSTDKDLRRPDFSAEEAVDTDKQPKPLLLRGFSTDQVMRFKSTGKIKEFQARESIPMDKDEASMIFVEHGEVDVYYNTDLVDNLKDGDVWGEETFVNPGALCCNLRARTDVSIRQFPRKRLIEFFTYNDKSLTDRFMLNMIQCLHVRWRRSIVKLGLASRSTPTDKIRNADET